MPAETIGMKSHKVMYTPSAFEAFIHCCQWNCKETKPQTTNYSISPLLLIITLAILEVCFMITFQVKIIHELDHLTGKNFIYLSNISLDKENNHPEHSVNSFS